ISNAHINHLSIGTKPNKFPVFIRHIRFYTRAVPEKLIVRTYAEMTKPFPLRTEFNITGNLDRYIIYAKTTSQKIQWTLNGVGSANGVFLSLYEGKTLGGRLTFDATVNWAPQWNWDVALKSSNLNLNTLVPTWPKQLSAVIYTKGGTVNEKMQYQLKAHITTPGARIDAETTKKDKLSIEWDVAIPQLSSLYQKFKGSITSHGEWKPEAAIPVTKGKLLANNVSLLGYQANQLNAQWTLYPKQQRASQFTISGSQLKTPKMQLHQINLQGKGFLHKHELNGQIAINGDSATFQMAGGLQNEVWKGQLKKLTLSAQPYHHWTMVKPTGIALSKTHTQANNLCLKSNGLKGELCLKGEWNSNSAWQIQANGTQFNPSLITSFITNKLNISSPSSIRAFISGNGKIFQSAKANIRLGKGQFRYQINGTYITSSLQQGNINLSFAKNSLSASTQLQFTKTNSVSASITLPKFSFKKKNNQIIHATIKANIADFTPFDKTLKTVANPKGNLFINLTAQGKIKSPDVRGQIRLQNGSVFIPKMGIELTNISSDITSFSKTQLHYKITAYSKNKPIFINGALFSTPKGMKLETNINADNVLLMNTPEYIINASPKLKATFQGHNVNLTGSIVVPAGVIQPINFIGMTTLPSDQIIYTAGEPIVSQSTWAVSADVKVTLGEGVIVNTSGFNATVSGEATIIGHPKKTTLANGRVNIIKGTYSAYGRTLTITPNSFIQFVNGPVDNPIFNIRATKNISVTQAMGGTQSFNINDITVGVNLHGSFRHPEISFFSIPANLSQADILSYLLLGYSASTASGSNISLLLDAASTLSGKGTGIGGAISQIKQGLGLAELGVENETVLDAIGAPIDQQQSFVIGKRLTKNIYIRYSLGLG
ncbi:MAG: translocation/assembly module TamB domain-containing protein, partial [Coxiellaceae bacterium]|nr:translocation/assembly module TamB domain-containing protein [Coxiellaceae bacterium]